MFNTGIFNVKFAHSHIKLKIIINDIINSVTVSLPCGLLRDLDGQLGAHGALGSAAIIVGMGVALPENVERLFSTTHR